MSNFIQIFFIYCVNGVAEYNLVGCHCQKKNIRKINTIISSNLDFKGFLKNKHGKAKRLQNQSYEN